MHICIPFFAGDITQKGYDKKRNKLLAPYMQQNKEEQKSKIDLKTPSFIPVTEVAASAEKTEANNGNIEPDSLDPNINNEAAVENVSASENQGEESKSESSNVASTSSNKEQGASAASKKPRSRHRQKRYTHSEKRYHSEVRQEAVQQALAQMNKQKPVPMPSKRSSVMTNAQNNEDTDESSGSGSEEEEQQTQPEAVQPQQSEQVTNVTLVSDTSSNNSLARPPTETPPSLPSMARPPTETPPSLPSRNPVGQPPVRPPMVTSPSRQNSR